MDDNKLRFGVGVLVISAIGIAIILTFLFGAFPSVLTRDYKLIVNFDSAEGIGVNSKVVRDGVAIGRVADVRLRPEGGVQVTLEMQLKHRTYLTHRYIPKIGAGSLVSGDAKLEFVKGSEQELVRNWGDDQEILDLPYSEIEEFIPYGSVTPGLLEMQDDLAETFDVIRTAGQSIADASNSVDQLAGDFREMVNAEDGKISEVADEAVAALQEFQGAMRDVRTIVGDPEMQRNLQSSIQQLPDLLQNVQETLDSTQDAFKSFQRVGDQFEQVGIAAEDTVESVQRTFNNIEQFTTPLAEQSDEMVAQVRGTLARVDSALFQVEEFGKSLNNGDGTLKRFLEDEELYYQIRRTITNIEEATAKVRPILDDVRIFSDKIARDPRQLGVRGAITKRPNGMGIK